MTQFDEQTKSRVDRMIATLRKREQSQKLKRDEKLMPQPVPKPQERSVQGASQVNEVLSTKGAKIIPFPTAQRIPANCWTMTPDIIRSALFGISKRGKEREFLRSEKILAADGIQLEFTGERLDQADMDVFMYALSLSRESGLGAKVYFTEHRFLKALGRNKGKKDHEWLKASLKRLTHCRLEFQTKRYSLLGGLIDACAKDEETGQYYLRFNPEFSKALKFQTYIPQKDRLKLRRSELAKWLYSYILSQSVNSSPHAVWSRTLQGLSGSNSCIKKFNQNLKKAFQTLERELPDFLDSWSIAQGKVQFKKKPYSKLSSP